MAKTSLFIYIIRMYFMFKICNVPKICNEIITVYFFSRAFFDLNFSFSLFNLSLSESLKEEVSFDFEMPELIDKTIIKITINPLNISRFS